MPTTGTQTIYRVSRRNGGVAVEGRSGLRRCHLQAESPQPTPDTVITLTTGQKIMVLEKC